MARAPTNALLACLCVCDVCVCDVCVVRQGFGGIYIDLESHEETQHQVFGLFADSNALYPDLFPALRKFEAEVVRMACTMLAGDDQATHPTLSLRACRHTRWTYACICLYL